MFHLPSKKMTTTLKRSSETIGEEGNDETPKKTKIDSVLAYRFSLINYENSNS